MNWTKKNLPGAKKFFNFARRYVKMDGQNPKAAETHSKGKNKTV